MFELSLQTWRATPSAAVALDPAGRAAGARRAARPAIREASARPRPAPSPARSLTTVQGGRVGILCSELVIGRIEGARAAS